MPRLISISRSPDNPLPSFALFPPDVMHLHYARGTTNGLWGLATSECDVECREMPNYLICFIWRRKPSDAGSEENDCFSFRFYDLCNSFKNNNPKVKYIILFIYFHFPFPFAWPSVRVRVYIYIYLIWKDIYLLWRHYINNSILLAHDGGTWNATSTNTEHLHICRRLYLTPLSHSTTL